MKHKAGVIAAIGAVAVVVGLTGCGSSGSAPTSSAASPALNGENNKTATQIISDVHAATAAASSVWVRGTVPSGGSPLQMSLHVGDQAATGSVLVGGHSVDIIRAGTTIYLKGPAGFYTSQGASSASANLVGGRWLRIPASTATTSSYASFLAMTDLKSLMGVLLSPSGSVTVAGTGTALGTPVVYLADGTGGKLAISLQGQPYPMEINSGNAATGQVTFSQWNAPIAARAPSGPVALSSAGG